MRDAWLRSSPLGLGLAGAAALWLAFPNGWISLPPLALLLPLCLALLGDSAPSAGAALRRGWLSSIVGMAAVLYWLTIPMATVGNLPMALAAVCAVLVATCLASWHRPGCWVLPGIFWNTSTRWWRAFPGCPWAAPWRPGPCGYRPPT